MKKTKIVCTIGPATHKSDQLEDLVAAGMNVARLNFSHGTRENHRKVIESIRQISAQKACAVAILQDLAGPKIRIGSISRGPVPLKPGQKYILTSRSVAGNSREVSFSYKQLVQDVKVNDRLLLADGAIELKVEQKTATDIICRVLVGGSLNSHKGINLPDTVISAATLTKKDKRDLAFGLDQGVDFVALSFVRSARDVEQVRKIIQRQEQRTRIIAKIERSEALDQIDSIIEAVDGIMIARGDLGVEIPIEKVPAVQKQLIDKAMRRGRISITATQMLRSMVDNPYPSRAEVSDVANAIYDGSSAIMLSEETAIGKYPLRTVQMMEQIALETERSFPYRSWTYKFRTDLSLSKQEAVARAACEMAEEVDAAAIITFTQSGSTTELVAKYRPSVPILALTPDEHTFQQLALIWGARPVLMDTAAEGEIDKQAVDMALKLNLIEKGDRVVITAGMPLYVTGTTNLIKIAEAE